MPLSTIFLNVSIGIGNVYYITGFDKLPIIGTAQHMCGINMARRNGGFITVLIALTSISTLFPGVVAASSILQEEKGDDSTTFVPVKENSTEDTAYHQSVFKTDDTHLQPGRLLLTQRDHPPTPLRVPPKQQRKMILFCSLYSCLFLLAVFSS